MHNRKIRQLLKVVQYAGYLGLFIVFADVVVLRYGLGYGYPRHTVEETIHRSPVPFVMFTGKPGAVSHNDFGFKGKSLKDAPPGALSIAFFGGSTGYIGNPTIPDVMETELSKLLDTAVFVANYSVVSSNHRQHLHAIIEYVAGDHPDLIVFYGGYNETITNAFYDPRPGYPYNYFYQSETPDILKVLIKHSAIIGTIEVKTGRISGLHKLREKWKPYSPEWNRAVTDKYFETLHRAKQLTWATGKATKPGFMAFYQPYRVPEEFRSSHHHIRKRIDSLDYVYDVSDTYDGIGEEVYLDIVHVNQAGKKVMGRRLAQLIGNALKPDTTITIAPALHQENN